MTAQRKFPNRSHMLKRLYRSTFQRGAIASIMLRTTQYRAYTTRPRQFSIPFMSGNSAPRTKNFARFTRLGLIEDILLVCYSSANMREKRWLLLALYGKYNTYSKHVQNGTRNSIDWKNSNSLRLSTRFSFRTVRTSLKLPIRCAVDKSVLGIFGLSISGEECRRQRSTFHPRVSRRCRSRFVHTVVLSFSRAANWFFSPFLFSFFFFFRDRIVYGMEKHHVSYS